LIYIDFPDWHTTCIAFLPAAPSWLLSEQKGQQRNIKMIVKNAYLLLGLTLLAQQSAASVPLGIIPVPLEMGGIAAAAAVSLIIAVQLIKRRK
jgi:hypothetical protein